MESNGSTVMAAPKDTCHVRGVAEGRCVSKVDAYKWGVQDSAGTLEWIEKHKLCVDHEYQRDRVSKNRVAELSKDWSWVACGCLIVARRPDGTLLVIDGQHRWLAACRRTDITAMPCIVFDSAGIQSEARGFFNANTNRGHITSYESFRALVAAANPQALAVRDLLAGRGYKAANQDDPFCVRCVGCLLRWYNKSPEVCRIVWDIAANLYNGDAVNVNVLAPMLFLEWKLARCRTNESLADKHNADKLHAIGHKGLLDAVNRAKGYYGKGGERVGAQAIADQLNKGRRTRRLPVLLNTTGDEEESAE